MDLVTSDARYVLSPGYAAAIWISTRLVEKKAEEAVKTAVEKLATAKVIQQSAVGSEVAVSAQSVAQAEDELLRAKLKLDQAAEKVKVAVETLGRRVATSDLTAVLGELRKDTKALKNSYICCNVVLAVVLLSVSIGVVCYGPQQIKDWKEDIENAFKAAAKKAVKSIDTMERGIICRIGLFLTYPIIR